MFDFVSIKKNLILFLFSVSIFFSYVNLNVIELRFIYLISIIFIFFENNILKTIKINLLKYYLPIFIFFLFHLYFNYLINFNYKLLENLSYLFLSKEIIQISIIILTTLIVYIFKELIISNFVKIFDFFILVFTTAIIIYGLNNFELLTNFLYSCDLGFFYYTKFIYLENSHFAVVATAAIFNFIYNFKYYLNKKFLFILNIIFIIFAFGTFSLSFYLSSLFSIILFIFCFKNIQFYRLILLLLFLVLTNIFFFSEKDINNFSASYPDDTYCTSQSEEFEKKYEKNKNPELFIGKVSNAKTKLKSLFSTNSKNFSVQIQLYSLYVSKEAIIQNPFGYGINSYKRYRQIIDNVNKGKIVDSVFFDEKIVFSESYMPDISPAVLNFNKNSGSNNLSKIVVEFGIFGAILLLTYLILFLSRKTDNQVKFLLFPLIFSQLFIRGTGYFNSGFLILSIILIILFIENLIKNEK